MHLTVAMMQPSVANASHRCDFCHVVGARIARPSIFRKLSIFPFPYLPPRGRGTARRRWKEFPRIARPYHPSRALSKPFIQPRVQGRNPARFNGGYGVPRGFKGGSKPSAPCGRLSEAEHPKRKGATLLRPLSAVNRNLPGNSHSRASAPCDFRFPPCFFPHSGRMAPIPLIP